MINLTEAEEELRQKLIGSFLFFVKTFFPLVTGREFHVSSPTGRESHHITLAKTFTSIQRQELFDTNINMPPGHGKSAMASMFVPWCWARYPDCQFLYISYAKDLAVKHTEFIRNFLLCPHYNALFGVKLDPQSRAKEQFKNTGKGQVKAFGSLGAITGQDGGLPNVDRFSGAVILDDMHKPDEVHSDTIRESVIRNYRETILQRKRQPNVPIISIAQRLHEDDLCAFMNSGDDEIKYNNVILKGIDGAGNALYPEVAPRDILLEKQAKSPYVFASQYQQDPIPAGGALFKPDDFIELDGEPQMLATFITADTAETDKTYNDATAFSFWGIYEVEYNEQKTGQYSLHWLDCLELRLEPSELQDAFMGFYADCMRHPTKPTVAAIEKKSTGVTLISVLKKTRGLNVVEVSRTRASGSKATRYLEMQPIISSNLVSFTRGARHFNLCVEHMKKITANDTHRHDDIADTAYDACKISFIDQNLGLLGINIAERKENAVLKSMAQSMQSMINS